MYTPNQILFPSHLIPILRESRGERWAALVDRVSSLPETDIETLGFMLLMIRLNNCMECETDSFRAMRGCDICALQTLRRYKGSDDDLLELYQIALEDVQDYLARNQRFAKHTTLASLA